MTKEDLASQVRVINMDRERLNQKPWQLRWHQDRSVVFCNDKPITKVMTKHHLNQHLRTARAVYADLESTTHQDMIKMLHAQMHAHRQKELERYSPVYDTLEQLTHALDNVLVHHASRMPPEDRRCRGELVKKARKLIADMEKPT